MTDRPMKMHKIKNERIK